MKECSRSRMADPGQQQQMVKQKGGLILSVHVGLIIWPFRCAGFAWESGYVFCTRVTFNTRLGYAPRLNGMLLGQRRHRVLTKAHA